MPLLFFFNFVLMNWMEWFTIPACPRSMTMCSFNRGNIEGTDSANLCLMYVLCLHGDWFCVLTWEVYRLNNESGFEM